MSFIIKNTINSIILIWFLYKFNITCFAKISAGQVLTCEVKSSRTKFDTPGDVVVPICRYDMTVVFVGATCSVWFAIGLPTIIF